MERASQLQKPQQATPAQQKQSHWCMWQCDARCVDVYNSIAARDAVFLAAVGISC